MFCAPLDGGTARPTNDLKSLQHYCDWMKGVTAIASFAVLAAVVFGHCEPLVGSGWLAFVDRRNVRGSRIRIVAIPTIWTSPNLPVASGLWARSGAPYLDRFAVVLKMVFLAQNAPNLGEPAEHLRLLKMVSKQVRAGSGLT